MENSSGKQIKFYPDVVMEEISAEGKSSEDPVKPLIMNLDTSDDDLQASPLPGARSPIESDTVSPQMPNRVNERGEETTSKDDDSVANWKLATSLITYQRKAKRNKDTTASDIASETLQAQSSLITLKDGKVRLIHLFASIFVKFSNFIIYSSPHGIFCFVECTYAGKEKRDPCTELVDLSNHI